MTGDLHLPANPSRSASSGSDDARGCPREAAGVHDRPRHGPSDRPGRVASRDVPTVEA